MNIFIYKLEKIKKLEYLKIIACYYNLFKVFTNYKFFIKFLYQKYDIKL